MPVITPYYISSYTFNNTSTGYIEPTYNSYSTIRDCGVYMFNGGTSFSIFSTIPNYQNFFNGVSASAITIPTTSGVNGTGGYGLYQKIDLADIDDEYLVHPGYGIIVHNALNFTGGHMINFENTSNELRWVSSTSGNNNKGASCQLFYKGIEIILF
jgi:hypothetical protein